MSYATSVKHFEERKIDEQIDSLISQRARGLCSESRKFTSLEEGKVAVEGGSITFAMNELNFMRI